MFVSIVSVRIFVSCFVRVEKNVKKYENLMIFVIFVIFNRGVPCLKNVQWSWNFDNLPFLRCINRISPSVIKFRKIFFSAHPSVRAWPPLTYITFLLFVQQLVYMSVLLTYLSTHDSKSVLLSTNTLTGARRLDRRILVTVCMRTIFYTYIY